MWARLREWWRRRFGDYAHRERIALPDGTRVVLTCGPNCTFSEHDGVWVTSWTPRRSGDLDDPDDYRLTREGDLHTTFARRDAIAPVLESPHDALHVHERNPTVDPKKMRQTLSNVRGNLKARGSVWGAMLLARLLLALAGGLVSAWSAWLWMTRAAEHHRLAFIAICFAIVLMAVEGLVRVAFAARFGRD
jgi:hypothetical protein